VLGLSRISALRTANLGFEEPWTARKKEEVREEEEEMMGPSLQRDLRAVMLFMVLLVVFVLLPVVSATKNFVILLEDDDSREPVDSVSNSGEELEGASEEKKMGRMGFASDAEEPVVEWDEFGDSEDKTDDDLDPGSWKQMLENPENSRQGSEVDTYIGILGRTFLARVLLDSFFPRIHVQFWFWGIFFLRLIVCLFFSP
jgi:hypothetical protein